MYVFMLLDIPESVGGHNFQWHCPKAGREIFCFKSIQLFLSKNPRESTLPESTLSDDSGVRSLVGGKEGSCDATQI